MYAITVVLYILSGVFYPFHLHNELAYQIKVSLNSSTRSEPDVRIDLPYDPFLFAGGLQQSGKLIKKRGHVYGIKKYSSLAPLLGDQWHLRVLNKQYDFCYVMLETVQFYLHQREPILDPIDPTRSVDGGFLLVFKFVRGDGVRRHWEDIVQIE